MRGSMFDRIARIDCTTGTGSVWQVPEGLQGYIGGIGYGTKILVDEVDPMTDPLSGGNKIVLTVGPLTGTTAPMHPQACIVTKSPLSNSILDCYAGGFLGAAVKMAGLDGIILEGAAPSWSVILIDDGKVSFHDASPVMGKGTEEAEAWMKRNFGRDVVTASIGVAGERLVAMSSIFSETRTFGRGGSGAVLGSKRIKGFAVRGTGGVDVTDRAAFSEIVSANMKGISEACAQEYNLVGMFARLGTGSGMSLVQSRGALATRNHVYGTFGGSPKIDGQYYEKNYYTKWVACYGCPVHCGRVHKYRNHDGSQGWSRGPEYETMFSFGSDLENGDPDLLAEVNHLTEVYGLDSLTTGVTIAWAIEMAEKGIIKEHSLPMKFGDPATILGLLSMIGERKGLGDILARGPQRAAEEMGHGSVASAMAIKNSGFAAWMPRRMKGVALAFATSMRGACHKRAPIGAEIIGQVDMGSYEGKAAMVKGIQDTVDSIFTLVSCRFHEFITPHDVYPAYIKASCGLSLTTEEFMRVGERIWNLQKLFNLGAGLTRADDTLPERCFTEPVLGDTSEGSVIDRDKFGAMLDEYYTVRGWNLDGKPKNETLAGLGISGYAGMAG